MLSLIPVFAEKRCKEQLYIIGEELIDERTVVEMKVYIDKRLGGGGNVLGIACRNRFMGIFTGMRWYAKSPLPQLVALAGDMAKQISQTSNFVEYSNPDSSKSLFPSKETVRCPTDPSSPIAVQK